MREKLLKLESTAGAPHIIVELQAQLKRLIEIESDYWQQRSHSNWLKFGNKNTK